MNIPCIFFTFRRWRERQIDDREADEDHPRDGVQPRRVPALQARRLLQHHPEPVGHHQRHEQAQDRLCRQDQTGRKTKSSLMPILSERVFWAHVIDTGNVLASS